MGREITNGVSDPSGIRRQRLSAGGGGHGHGVVAEERSKHAHHHPQGVSNKKIVSEQLVEREEVSEYGSEFLTSFFYVC
jgi:hypothetical protein